MFSTDLSRFRCLDVRDGHNVLRVIFVELSRQFSPLRSNAADDANDVKDAVRCVSRIIPFGTIGQPEIGARLQPRLFQYRPQHVVGHSGVYRRLENDEFAVSQTF